MVNNPRYLGGAMDKAAGEKTARLVQLCDTFHLPIVYFCDEPGFMVGLEEEKKGIIRAGARMVALNSLSRTPYITFILRQVYGVAGGLHYRGGSALYRRFAWPSGHWGSMHIEGGVSAAYRREIDAAPDPRSQAAGDRSAAQRTAVAIPHRACLRASKTSSTRARRARCSWTSSMKRRPPSSHSSARPAGSLSCPRTTEK